MTSATENRTTERVDHSPRVREAVDELMREKDATGNRTTELRISEPLRGFIRHQSNRAYIDGGQARWLTDIADKIDAKHEQVIAATLGNTTCEYVIEDNMNESEGMGDVWFRCTNCDMCFDYADDWLLKMPHCPKCGATVKRVR